MPAGSMANCTFTPGRASTYLHLLLQDADPRPMPCHHVLPVQAMSSLLPQRAAVPPGLRLALLLACAFPSAIMPASSALECSTPGFAQGVCLGLMLSLWLATQRILAWVVKSPSQGVLHMQVTVSVSSNSSLAAHQCLLQALHA